MDRQATGRRAVLSGLAALSVGAAAPAAWARRAKPAGRFDAVLSKDGQGAHGAPGYRTLGEALAAAPAAASRPFRILVPAGTWRERNTVDKPNIHLIGEGREASVIVFNDSAQTRRQPGAANEMATLVVQAPDFHAAHLTIANDFDYPGHMPAEVAYDRTGASGAQATALKLGKGSDRALFEDVAVTGWQDTLFTDA
ncbi:MAG: hypothetical protein JWP92_3430, partial [Caulobacter sp.]|nr:hypothetical protein [Caulobacter sp.]